MLVLLTTFVLSASACLDDECRKMRRCCAAVHGEPWIGDSCGELANGVRDPATCHTIHETVVETFKQRGAELPAACIETQ